MSTRSAIEKRSIRSECNPPCFIIVMRLFQPLPLLLYQYFSNTTGICEKIKTGSPSTSGAMLQEKDLPALYKIKEPLRQTDQTNG